jgi:hypothetical protein
VLSLNHVKPVSERTHLYVKGVLNVKEINHNKSGQLAGLDGWSAGVNLFWADITKPD